MLAMQLTSTFLAAIGCGSLSRVIIEKIMTFG